MAGWGPCSPSVGAWGHCDLRISISWLVRLGEAQSGGEGECDAAEGPLVQRLEMKKFGGQHRATSWGSGT